MTCTKNMTPCAVAAMLAASLSACGGGGGGSPGTTTDATPVTTSFPIQQALAYAFTHGMQANLSITGTVTNGASSTPISGTLSYGLGIASNTTFEGAVAMQSTESLSATMSGNGTTQPISTTGALMLNAQYAPIGERSSDDYCVATGTPSYPATATAGQTGAVATFNCYADSSKRTLINVQKLTYVTTPGSDANSLNFQIVTTDYGLTTTPQSSYSTTYTISSAGVPKLTRVQLTMIDNGTTATLDAK